MLADDSKQFDNYEEFLLFLYVHIAAADYSMQGDEIALILEKMSDHFDEGIDLEDLFIDVKDSHEELSEEEIGEVIRNNFAKYGTSEDRKNKIFNDLMEIVAADGHLDDGEAKALDHIKELIA